MNEKGIFTKSSYGDGNRVNFSRLNFFEEEGRVSNHIALKYVLGGTENYEFNNRRYPVTGGKFLLINPGQVYDTSLKSKTDVTGLCINLDKNILQDTYHILSRNTGYLMDNPTFVNHNPLDVFETIYDQRQCGLGEYLQQLSKTFASSTQYVNKEDKLYFKLAECLLESQGLVKNSLQRLSAGKESTRKELLRRLLHAKQWMDEYYQTPLLIDAIAAEAALSPYHFLRAFKQAFNVTPHQYLLKKRLEAAKDCLLSGRYTVGEAAHLNGFADIHSFSKSFRKAYNSVPSKFLR